MKDKDSKSFKALLRINYLTQFLFGSSLLICAIILWLYLPVAWPLLTKIGISLLLATFVVAALYLKISAYLLLSKKIGKLLPSIDSHPESIVWVYATVVISMPFGIRLFSLATVYCHFINGNKESFFVSGSKLQSTLEQLNRLLPHASFGYSLNKEQLFRASPLLLLKSQTTKYQHKPDKL